MTHLEAQAQAIDRQWQLRLERARYEADRGRRDYLEVEPEPRVVARSLERDWHEKLMALEQLERDEAESRPRASHHVSEAERQGILDLVHDLPALWHADPPTPVERNQGGRLLIKDVMVTKLDHTVRVDGRWPTPACSTLEVPRSKPAYVVRRTAPAVSARIEQFARDHSEIETAERLNQAGDRSGSGATFSATKVNWLRYAYGIKSGCPLGPVACPTGHRGDGRYSAQAAAQQLNVSVSTIAAWCKAGHLDGVHVAPRGPWWVKLPSEVSAALGKPVRQYKPRRAMQSPAPHPGSRQPARRGCIGPRKEASMPRRVQAGCRP
jgi:hypothetical protein